MEIREIAHNSSDYEAEVDLRLRLLRTPLGLSFTEAQLSEENSCIHIGAFDHDLLIGCLVLVPKDAVHVQMRQVAVETTHQNKGIGSGMVRFSERVAGDNGFGQIILNARITAVAFYTRLDYRTVGEEFIEVKIPHRKMVKDLGSSLHEKVASG